MKKGKEKAPDAESEAMRMIVRYLLTYGKKKPLKGKKVCV